ncbi:MAG: N-acetyltransferase [Planctomycetota bacterium]
MDLADVRIETARLILRELDPADTLALAAIEGDPEVVRYLAFNARTPELVREKIDEAVRDRKAEFRLSFDLAVVLRETGVLIGRCGFALRRPEHLEAEIWWVFSPTARGRGFATEAAAAVLDLAFGSLRCHRVYADCDPRNIPSCNVARRLGMTYEGRMRENYYLKDEWCDADIFGLLDREWRAIRAASKGTSGQ